MQRPGELPLGTPLPPLNAHAITVSIPKWEHYVGYQEGDPSVMQCLLTGYPRFVIHAIIAQLADIILREKGQDDEKCILFPIASYAYECRAYLLAQNSDISPTRLRQEVFSIDTKGDPRIASIDLHVVFYPSSIQRTAGQFWQHTGFGISSRLTQRCLDLLGAPAILPASRYGNPSQYPKVQVGASRSVSTEDFIQVDTSKDCDRSDDHAGHMAPFSTRQAKAALRRRIAGLISYEDFPNDNVVCEEDVFLYPTGMTGIWHAHQLLIAMRPMAKFVCFGFPYADTLKILEKWGPGCHFFGHDLESNMNELETLLSSSQNFPPISALFCEIPSNPRLESPPLDRLRVLADKYDFLIVVDDTVGSWVNVNVLPYVDIIATSLSKYVCGYATALGGSLVFNPRMRHYQKLKEAQICSFTDTYFEEDAIVMEENSRDISTRMRTINANANVLCEFLRSRSLLASSTDETFVLKEIFYPKWITRAQYDLCRVRKYSDGQASEDNFGGLFSLTFVSSLASQVFLDALPCAKGPSLGTNFTLVCPYTILAHYKERAWAAEYGVDENLVRVSVGLEDQATLLEDFGSALRKAEGAVRKASGHTAKPGKDSK